MIKISQLINKKRLYFDGGMGTVLQKRGLKSGDLPDNWNLKHPEIIESIHREYLDAGANIITTNTFGVNCLKHDNYEELIVSAVNCAKNAVKDYDDGFVAFDIGPLGKFLEPIGDLPFETAVEVFAKNIRVAQRCGVDLVIIETFTDCYETKAAVLAAKENSDLPIFVTNVYDENGKMLTGASIEAMVAMLEGLGVAALGTNCSLGPDKMINIIERFSKCSSLPIIANPNAGLPVMVNGKTTYTLNARDFASSVLKLAESGANILGGCCGTEPDYIKELVDATRSMPIRNSDDKNLSVVTSYSKAVNIGESPILIGERINPTGKPKLKEALKKGDIEYILEQGLTQSDAGAHILDVNVGLPEIDEAETMEKIVTALQAVCDLPLSLDSNDPAVLERAMRVYNGKPLINSVNGDDESMEKIFPLIKKYGGSVIALTLDKHGIPGTAEDRVKIAQHILKKANEFGIPSKDIIFDPLALTIATGAENADITLEAVDMLHSMNLKTSLGVSNISFGMPERDKINSAFFSLALSKGLSCAIMNPSSASMMQTYRSFNGDAGCDFPIKKIKISSFSVTDTDSQNSATDLKDAIRKGLVDLTISKTYELLKNDDPMSIVNNQIIPALNEVGDRFEKHEIFLPQLLRSAECSSKAFALIKENMTLKTSNGNSVIIATVQGDIHDIGKNIVKLLLESHGFTVYDLGKDVSPQTVLDALEKYGSRLVALSALMTTTLPAMDKTVQMIKSLYPDVYVMVGGAVLTEEYAKAIGADAYGKDAMAAVRFAQTVYK